MLETHKYVRKQFDIDAVQVNERNMADVTAWVNGSIKLDEKGRKFISVDVKNPLNERQKQAYAGDWVLYTTTGFKCYTNKAFRSSFEQASVETTLHDVSPRQQVEVFGGVPIPEPIATQPAPPAVVPADVRTDEQKAADAAEVEAKEKAFQESLKTPTPAAIADLHQ